MIMTMITKKILNNNIKIILIIIIIAVIYLIIICIHEYNKGIITIVYIYDVYI
jgi:hypothetical protein